MSFRTAFMAAALAAAVAAAPAPASAQQSLAVAVVDIPVVMQNSAAAKGVRAQLDKEEAGYRTDFQRREGEFRNAYQQLTSDFGKLGADVANDRRASFERRYAEFEREGEFRKQDLQGRYERAMKKVEDALKSVLMDLATERKMDMILQRGAVLFIDSSRDLTQEALKRLDGKLASVTIDKAAPLPKAPGTPSAQTPRANQPAAPKGQ